MACRAHECCLFGFLLVQTPSESQSHWSVDLFQFSYKKCNRPPFPRRWESAAALLVAMDSRLRGNDDFSGHSLAWRINQCLPKAKARPELLSVPMLKANAASKQAKSAPNTQTQTTSSHAPCGTKMACRAHECWLLGFLVCAGSLMALKYLRCLPVR